MTRTLPLLAALLALTACSPRAVHTVSPIAQLSPPLTAHGTEPFWAVKFDGGEMTLTTAGHPGVSAPAKLLHLAPNGARWAGRTADGRAMEFAIVAIDCTDGMSERAYNLGAEVRLDGEVLKGCAEKGV